MVGSNIHIERSRVSRKFLFRYRQRHLLIVRCINRLPLIAASHKSGHSSKNMLNIIRVFIILLFL